jgi:hypothetical protein
MRDINMSRIFFEEADAQIDLLGVRRPVAALQGETSTQRFILPAALWLPL